MNQDTFQIHCYKPQSCGIQHSRETSASATDAEAEMVLEELRVTHLDSKASRKMSFAGSQTQDLLLTGWSTSIEVLKVFLHKDKLSNKATPHLIRPHLLILPLCMGKHFQTTTPTTPHHYNSYQTISLCRYSF